LAEVKTEHPHDFELLRKTINKDSPIRRFLLQKTRIFYVFCRKIAGKGFAITWFPEAGQRLGIHSPPSVECLEGAKALLRPYYLAGQERLLARASAGS
jgi:hypothetical protein